MHARDYNAIQLYYFDIWNDRYIERRNLGITNDEQDEVVSQSTLSTNIIDSKE
jgi:hypothetical protein